MENWRKSSYSGANPNCVECRTDEGVVQVRDSRNPDLGILSVPPTEWHAFVTDMKNHEL